MNHSPMRRSLGSYTHQAIYQLSDVWDDIPIPPIQSADLDCYRRYSTKLFLHLHSFQACLNYLIPLKCNDQIILPMQVYSQNCQVTFFRLCSVPQSFYTLEIIFFIPIGLKKVQVVQLQVCDLIIFTYFVRKFVRDLFSVLMIKNI